MNNAKVDKTRVEEVRQKLLQLQPTENESIPNATPAPELPLSEQVAELEKERDHLRAVVKAYAANMQNTANAMLDMVK